MNYTELRRWSNNWKRRELRSKDHLNNHSSREELIEIASEIMRVTLFSQTNNLFVWLLIFCRPSWRHSSTQTQIEPQITWQTKRLTPNCQLKFHPYGRNEVGTREKDNQEEVHVQCSARNWKRNESLKRRDKCFLVWTADGMDTNSALPLSDEKWWEYTEQKKIKKMEGRRKGL